VAETYAWYDAKKPELGLEFLERVEEAIETISENPAGEHSNYAGE
jgi:hypothetical protein